MHKQPAITMAHVEMMVNVFVMSTSLDLIAIVSVILYYPFIQGTKAKRMVDGNLSLLF